MDRLTIPVIPTFLSRYVPFRSVTIRFIPRNEIKNGALWCVIIEKKGQYGPGYISLRVTDRIVLYRYMWEFLYRYVPVRTYGRQTHRMGMFPKFPRKVWVSLVPVCLVMALVTMGSMFLAKSVLYQTDLPLPWWSGVVFVLVVYSAMFGPYVVWLTVSGIEYRQTLQEV